MFDQMATQDWAVSHEIFPEDFCRALARECRQLHEAGTFNKASIGPTPAKKLNHEIRGDYTLWLDEQTGSELQKRFMQQLDLIKQKLNESFYLGLKRFECHFALYPPGTGYDKHVDNHRGSSSRRITFILYLNEEWQKEHGGELSIYDPLDENHLIQQVEPRLGTFVLFRSEVFPHQVEKSHTPRMSLTGWIRDDAL